MKELIYKKLKMKSIQLKSLIMCGLAFVLFSCGAKLVPVNYGNITTQGVVIKAEDGSFVLTSGDTWTPPFQSSMKDPDDHTVLGSKITTRYDFAMELDAKKVKVKTPYMEKELYGVLMLNKAIEGCKSPVTRSYQISIPEEYVQKALNGQVSVLYEYYDCGKRTAQSWILWLSDVPF
ncbi:MAG TPA: hypothetical protein VKY36_02965 [Moheibacter sp.]|nr:hypothetical protein [Moheibacter sp.]